MLIINMLLFFATFISIVLVTTGIYLTYYNKRTRILVDKFILQVNELKPTVFQDITLRYRTTSGQKTQISPNNNCDLYLFDNCLAIVRRQNFIFKVFFAPVLLTSDIETTKNMFDYLDCYKPGFITFKQIVKGEVDIKLTDPIYKNYKIDITFKGLTNEQTIELERIKNWC